MKEVTKEILGFKVKIQVAESVAELIQLAGSEERVVDLANNYILFHSHFSKARTAIVKKLEELTTIKREVDKEGKVTEDDKPYVGRVEDELGGTGSLSKFDTDIATLVAGMKVDYTQTERGTGDSAAPAKKWLTYYDALKANDGTDQLPSLSSFCAKYEIATDGVSEDDLRIIVANKVKSVVDAIQKAAVKSAGL